MTVEFPDGVQNPHHFHNCLSSPAVDINIIWYEFCVEIVQYELDMCSDSPTDSSGTNNRMRRHTISDHLYHSATLSIRSQCNLQW